MRVLFLTCQPPHYMAPPKLGDEQINCGPCFLNQEINGRWISRSTPFGEYDLTLLASEIPADQTPDVVVCHVDCGFCLKPRNLAAFKCPKILLAADSHWGDHALSSMIRYAASEPFDRVVVLYDRHHLELYRAAGVRNLHWFPALTFAHPDERIHASAAVTRENRIALVGQTGYHYRRQRIFSALITAGLPLSWRQIRQSEAISHYSGSLIGLNVTMNADLNLRVFEIISGGAMLLNDRLGADAGLDQLLVEGREKISYNNAEELIELARHYLANPDEARAIGAAGRRWFLEHFNEKRRRDAFQDLVFNGRDLPEFESPRPISTCINFGAQGLKLSNTLPAYDLINELHRHQELVVIQADDTVPADFDALVATLPRVQVVRTLPAVGKLPIDLFVCGQACIPPPQSVTARHLWCWDCTDEKLPALRSRFTTAGLLASNSTALFSHPRIDIPAHQKKAVEARNHLDAGDLQGALTLAQETLAAHPQSSDAYLVLAELAFDVGNRALFEKMMTNARRSEPTNPRIALLRWSTSLDSTPRQAARLLNTAWKAFERLELQKAEKYATRALEADKSLADAHYILSLAYFRSLPDRSKEAYSWETQEKGTAALYAAVELAPHRADLSFALGIALHEAGFLPEAISTYGRSLEISPQNTLGWFALGSAYSEMGQLASAKETFLKGLQYMPTSQLLSSAADIAEKRYGRLEAALNLQFQVTHSYEQKKLGRQALKLWQRSINSPADLALLPILAREHSLSYDHAMDLLIDTAEAVSRSKDPLQQQSSLPQRTVVFAYQAWFNLNTRELVAQAFEQGTLLALFTGVPNETAPDEKTVSLENFRCLVHREVPLWLVCRYKLALALGTIPERITAANPDHLQKIRAIYGQAIELIDKACLYFDFYRPESVIIAQGYDLVSAVLRHMAVQRGLRVVTLENTFHRERILWDDTSGIAVNLNQAKNHYWRYRDLITPAQAAQIAGDYLSSIKSLKSTEHASPATALEPTSTNNLRTIMYIGQVGLDSSVLFGLRGFTSQVDVIAALAAYAAEHSLRLLIKLHPKEGPSHEESWSYFRNFTASGLNGHAGFQASQALLGDNLIIDAENKFNTYELIRQADACVTINSQAGLEATLLGKEVVLCGDAFYGALGFTHEAIDPKSLGFCLDRILHDGLRLNQGMSSKTFFYIFTQLYCLPKTTKSVLSLLQGRPAFLQVRNTDAKNFTESDHSYAA